MRMRIEIKKIDVGRWKVREGYNGQEFTELKESILENGLVVPLACREVDGRYELVCGHRRYQALVEIGAQETEITVHDWDDEACMIAALAENVQRKNLSAEEEGRAYIRMQGEFGLSLRQIAARIGVHHSHIDRMIAYVREIEQMQLVADGDKPSEFVVRAVRTSGVPDEYKKPIVEKALKEDLTAKEVERVAKSVAIAPEPAKEKLIEHPYSTFVHDPDRVAEQIKLTPGRDPVVQKPKPKADADWRQTPEVKAMLDRLAQIEKEWAPAYLKMIDLGKLDPAGYAFVAGKVRRAITALEKVLERLEE